MTIVTRRLGLTTALAAGITLFAIGTAEAQTPLIVYTALENDQLAPFYEEIAALTGSHKVLPMNSGAEAVESAIRAVRKWGYEAKGVPDDQAEIVVCSDNFHGRTLGIVSFSTVPSWTIRAGEEGTSTSRRSSCSS
mgnify:CR=1 FL=1